MGVDAAKKFGGKTVFFRSHGIYTLYALDDFGGRVEKKGYGEIPSEKEARWVAELAAARGHVSKEEEAAMMKRLRLASLRSQVIRLASTLPKGDNVRKSLLRALQE